MNIFVVLAALGALFGFGGVIWAVVERLHLRAAERVLALAAARREPLRPADGP